MREDVGRETDVDQEGGFPFGQRDIARRGQEARAGELLAKTADDRWTDSDIKDFMRLFGHAPTEVIRQSREENRPERGGGAVDGGGTGGGAGGGGGGTGGGVTLGEYEDYYNLVVQIFASLGITEGTAQRLGFLENSIIDSMAIAKMDAASIRDRFANEDSVVAINPGAPFGMTGKQYEQAVRGLGEAEQSVFGKQISDFSSLTKQRSAREGTTAGLALRERMDPAEYARQLERFRQERGRTPTQSEFEERRSRPTYQAKQVQFAPPQRQPQETPRPAVGPVTTSPVRAAVNK